MAKVIFATLHHKKNPSFERGLKLILKDYPVVVLNTGFNNGFGEFGLKDQVTYINAWEQISYDQGLMRMKDILSEMDWDIVHFLDNDLFITDTTYIKKTIDAFEESDFGFCSYFENGSEIAYTGLITEVKNQTFKIVPEFPGFKPTPQWENAMMMFKRSVWDSLTKHDLSYGRFCIRALHDSGVKMGVKKRETRSVYSHKGQGWFHVGNLMSYYYMIENLDMSKLNRNSEIDLARIGYFLTEKWEGLTPEIERNLDIISSAMGKEKCIAAWQNLYEGTN